METNKNPHLIGPTSLFEKGSSSARESGCLIALDSCAFIFMSAARIGAHQGAVTLFTNVRYEDSSSVPVAELNQRGRCRGGTDHDKNYIFYSLEKCGYILSKTGISYYYRAEHFSC